MFSVIFVVAKATCQKLSDMAFQVELEQENEKLKVTFPKKLGNSKKIRESIDDITIF